MGLRLGVIDSISPSTVLQDEGREDLPSLETVDTALLSMTVEAASYSRKIFDFISISSMDHLCFFQGLLLVASSRYVSSPVDCDQNVEEVHLFSSLSSLSQYTISARFIEW